MNQNNQYMPPNFGNAQPVFNGRYRFVFLGFLFPVFFFVIMVFVQSAATFMKSFQMGLELGLQGSTDISELALEQELTAFLNKYSNLFSVVSAVMTVVLVFLVYLIISSRFQKWNMTPPSMKTYFSLKKISTGLVLKSILLAFFFYHFVLGFLNLVALLAPDLAKSYSDAVSSVESGTSAFTLVTNFLAVVVAAPIVEELIFRNMAISNMNSRMPKALSVVISSAIFGVFHGNLVWILYAFGLGLLFGFLYVKSGSIYVSLVMHTTFNLIGFIYSVLGNLASESAINVINWVSFGLILASILAAPAVFLWVWFGLSPKKKKLETN